MKMKLGQNDDDHESFMIITIQIGDYMFFLIGDVHVLFHTNSYQYQRVYVGVNVTMNT